MIPARPAVPVITPPRRLGLFAISTAWCLVLGPPIGAAPIYIVLGAYIDGASLKWLANAIAFSYVLGGIPALVGGALYSALLAADDRHAYRSPALRAAVGAACGAVGALLAGIRLGGFQISLLLILGAAAGAISAALFKGRWIDRFLPPGGAPRAPGGAE